jgi:hypothetical protein
VLVGGLVVLLNLVVPALLAGAVAALTAIAICFTLDRLLGASRRAAAVELERIVKNARRKGVEEESLRRFIARQCGADWEEPYEHLFGYSAKLDARRLLPIGSIFHRRQKFRAWRDPLIAWLEAIVIHRRQARDRRYFEETEAAGLRAEGAKPAVVREQARISASAIVEQAHRVRGFYVAALSGDELAAAQKRTLIEAIMHPARTTRLSAAAGWRRMILHVADLAMGARSRFLVGAAALLGGAIWADRYGLFTDGRVVDYQSLVAGFLLLTTSFLRGRRIYLFAWPAAVVAWFGDRLGIPGFASPWTSQVVSVCAGIAIWAVGLAFGRSR